MVFKGDAPYGVNDDRDDMLIPQEPPDVRIAVGGNHIAYLVVNGPITVRNRETIEQVVRTLNSRGIGVVTFIIRDNGAQIDTDVSDINFAEGIEVQSISPGVVRILIGDDAIDASMLADAIIQSVHIASGAVTESKIADGAITAAKIANNAITTNHIANGSIGETDLANDAVSARVLADASVNNGAMQTNSVGTTNLIDGSVTGPKIAANSITTDKIVNGSVTPDDLDRFYYAVGAVLGLSIAQTIQSISANTFAASGTLHTWTFNLSPDLSYRVFGVALFRGFGAGGTTADGNLILQTDVGGGWVGGTSVAHQFDQGVDSTGFALFYVSTNGNAQYRLQWNRTGGTLQVNGGTILMFAVPTTTSP